MHKPVVPVDMWIKEKQEYYREAGEGTPTSSNAMRDMAAECVWIGCYGIRRNSVGTAADMCGVWCVRARDMIHFCSTPYPRTCRVL